MKAFFFRKMKISSWKSFVKFQQIHNSGFDNVFENIPLLEDASVVRESQ